MTQPTTAYQLYRSTAHEVQSPLSNSYDGTDYNQVANPIWFVGSFLCSVLQSEQGESLNYGWSQILHGLVGNLPGQSVDHRICASLRQNHLDEAKRVNGMRAIM